MSDEKEFLDLLHRNRAIIYKVCWHFAGDDAFYFQEYRQEIYLILWNEYQQHRWERFSHLAEESTWVYRIAYNTACYRHKLHLRQPPTCPIDTLDMISQDNDLEAQEKLFDLLEQLSNDTDRRMIDYRMQGYRNAEIAKKEATTETAVSTRMSRIIAKLSKIAQNKHK